MIWFAHEARCTTFDGLVPLSIALPWSNKAERAAKPDEASAPIEECVRLYNGLRLQQKITVGALLLALGIGSHDMYSTQQRGPGLAVVLQPSQSGLSEVGTAGASILPSDEIIEAGIRTWLMGARCINGIASCEYQRNQARAMTDQNSAWNAKAHLDDSIALSDKMRSEDPTAAREFQSVSVFPQPYIKTEAYRIFQLSWNERIVSTHGISSWTPHTGRVTVANAHPISTDKSIAQYNADGLYVEQFSTDSDLR